MPPIDEGREPDPRPAEAPFFPVSPTKFFVLSLCTLTLYDVYWGYQQWKRLRDQHGEDVSPFWRAFFLPFWMFSLLPYIRTYALKQRVPATWDPAFAALGFLVLGFTWRLPDPWWLISLLGFLPLMPAVITIRELHFASRTTESPNSAFSLGNIFGCLFGFLILGLVVIGTFMPPVEP